MIYTRLLKRAWAGLRNTWTESKVEPEYLEAPPVSVKGSGYSCVERGLSPSTYPGLPSFFYISYNITQVHVVKEKRQEVVSLSSRVEPRGR